MRPETVEPNPRQHAIERVAEQPVKLLTQHPVPAFAFDLWLHGF
jgi:hypothetical protein